MKVMTIVGTRPELIRLCIVISKLDKYCQHVLVHTGQNYDDHLSKIFFKELNIREPNYHFDTQSITFGEQIVKIFTGTHEIFEKERPDKVLVLGDTNSALSCIVAKRMGIPVYHMEAGNRCFDDKVPEEVNRKIIDHCSSIHMPYTQRSKENLLWEGISLKDIYVIGNPINEVLHKYNSAIIDSQILRTLNIKGQYFLVTAHRAENVDNSERLQNIIEGIGKVSKKFDMQVVCSVHPRTRSKLEQFKIMTHNHDIIFSEPFGFFDFVKLERNAACVITDSGTVQEEASILGIPSVTIRDTTERQETVECGGNMVCGVEPDAIVEAVTIALSERYKWKPPIEYLEEDVSGKVVKIILGF